MKIGKIEGNRVVSPLPDDDGEPVAIRWLGWANTMTHEEHMEMVRRHPVCGKDITPKE